jgi:putative DNA methylase
MVLIGTCVEASSNNVLDMLKNNQFQLPVALQALPKGLAKNGSDQPDRNGAGRGTPIFSARQAGQPPEPLYPSLYNDHGEGVS